MTASKAPTLPESHGTRSSGKGRDEIMTASKAATVPENLDAMQVDGLSPTVAKTNCATGRSSEAFRRSERFFKVSKGSRRDKSRSNNQGSSTISGRREAYVSSNNGGRGLGGASGENKDNCCTYGDDCVSCGGGQGIRRDDSRRNGYKSRDDAGNSSNESGPDKRNKNTKLQIERCSGKVRGIGEAIRPSSGGSHDSRHGKNVPRPTTALEDIPEEKAEETTLEQPMSITSAAALVSPMQTTPTYEVPAPAAMNMSENMTGTPLAPSLATPCAVTESGSISKPMSLRTLPKRENITFHPYKRLECHHADIKRNGLV